MAGAGGTMIGRDRACRSFRAYPRNPGANPPRDKENRHARAQIHIRVHARQARRSKTTKFMNPGSMGRIPECAKMRTKGALGSRTVCGRVFGPREQRWTTMVQRQYVRTRKTSRSAMLRSAAGIVRHGGPWPHRMLRAMDFDAVETTKTPQDHPPSRRPAAEPVAA